jgi:hypothetical protein
VDEEHPTLQPHVAGVDVGYPLMDPMFVGAGGSRVEFRTDPRPTRSHLRRFLVCAPLSTYLRTLSTHLRTLSTHLRTLSTHLRTMNGYK